MGNIVLLDDLTINQIAAGEVIERPASVVKEMLENSIDAGAKNITIEIKNGGISLIRITDDGSGIAEDDMEIAFERHATSKIRSAKDLSTVKSMGFRGEALASIAAIARVEMVSKKAGMPSGNKIVIEGGKVLEKSEIGCPVGTSITVENLFYNTPVRYKFLKKDYTESGYVEDAVTRIALVNKDVSITLISNGKTIIHTSGNGDMQSVIYSIYGKDIAKGIIEVFSDYEDIKITGVIGKSSIAKTNRSNQLFFVNNRYVKDKTLTAALDKAYTGILPIGKYGFAVLNIEMNPSFVDVNVHPAKLEVRFQDESLIFKAIYHAVKSTLENSGNSKLLLEPDVEKEKSSLEIVNENLKGEIVKSDLKRATFEERLAKIEQRNSKAAPKGFEGFLSKIKKNKAENSEENANTLKEIYEARKKEIYDGLKNKIDDTEEKKEIKEETKPKEDTKDIEKLEKAEESKSNILYEKTDAERYIEENNIDIEKQKEKYLSKFRENKNKKILEDIKPENNDENVKESNPLSTDTLVSEGNSFIPSIKFEIPEEIKTENLENTNTEIISSIENKEQEVIKTDIESASEEIEKEDIKPEKEDGTADIEAEVKPEVNEIEQEESEKLRINIANNQKSEPEVSSESITEKLLEQKFKSNKEDTQLIDTRKVREALNETSQPKEFEEMYKKTFGVDTFLVRKEKEQEEKDINAAEDFKPVNQQNETIFTDEGLTDRVNYKLIGQVFSNYIIIEIANEMYIINIRSANERIIYESIKETYYNDEEKDSQVLLLPDIITLSSKEMFTAKQNEYMLNNAGFEFEEFGANTVKLVGVPAICEKLNTKQLFIEILDGLETVAITETKEKEEKFISTIACKSAEKSRVNLDEKEIDELIQKILSFDNPFTYPYGSQVAIKMTRYDLEKKFSRR